MASNLVDLEDLVPVVVYDLHRDASGLRTWEGTGASGVQRRPRGLVDLGLERLLQPRVRVDAAAGEVAVPDEEGLFVVGGVDHPHGDLVRIARPDLPCRGVVDIDS